MVSEIPTPKILHDHVKIFPVLEWRNHIDNEGIVQLFKDSFLIDNRPDTFLQQNSTLNHILLCFWDLLHGVDMAILFLLDLPYPAKASGANLV